MSGLSLLKRRKKSRDLQKIEDVRTATYVVKLINERMCDHLGTRLSVNNHQK